jgi:hypothetical protein
VESVTAIEKRRDRPRMRWWHLVLLGTVVVLALALKASGAGAGNPWVIAVLGLVFHAAVFGVLTLFSHVRTMMRRS